MRKSTFVIGVIGTDCHAVGNKVLDCVFTAHNFHVINLGVMVSQDEYIDAVIETGVGAIVVSSIYGRGDIGYLGLRERCIERSLGDILLHAGGNLVVGKHDFADAEAKSKEMGFNRVFAPSHDLEDICAFITNDIHQHNGLEQCCLEEAI